MSEAVLNEFDARGELLSRVTDKAAVLVQELLDQYEINVHSVTSRTKSRASLQKKLSKPGRSYQSLNDITDICGIRIITYFEEDVDRVVEVLEREFEIDRTNSIDKRLVVDPDRFGYMSAHHVLKLTPTRVQLHEYRWLDGFFFEIQTRSILQHAWAEIEHDLGYKSKNEVPRNVRRRFSRLAGILELADNEFNGIRDELANYDAEIAIKIQTDSSLIEINKNSLLAFVKTNAIVKELDTLIVELTKSKLAGKDDAAATYGDRLLHVGLKTVADLESSLIENRGLIKKFVTKWFGEEKNSFVVEVNNGISILFLLYVLLASRGDSQAVVNYFLGYKLPEKAANKIAGKVIEVFRSIT